MRQPKAKCQQLKTSTWYSTTYSKGMRQMRTIAQQLTLHYAKRRALQANKDSYDKIGADLRRLKKGDTQAETESMSKKRVSESNSWT